MNPMLTIVWLYRYWFLGVMLVAFVVLSAVILTLPQRYILTSSIEVASRIVGDRLEAIEPPDQVAKQITESYLPAASALLAEKGASPAAIAEVQNLRAEVIGRTISIRGSASPQFADTYRELQQVLVDHLQQDAASSFQAIRDALQDRLDAANRIANELQTQIQEFEERSKEAAARSEELRKQALKRQAELTEMLQAAGKDEHGNIEAQARELREQIGVSEVMRTDLILARSVSMQNLSDLRYLLQEQRTTLAKTQRETKMLTNTHVLSGPSITPLPDRPRRIYLLGAALVASVLLAFGAVVLLYRLKPKDATT